MLSDVEERSLALHEEADLRTVLELLPEWVAFLDLANDCTDGAPETALDRRLEAFRKVVLPGGQNRYHYSQVARALGYDVDIVDIVEGTAFEVEASSVEDPIDGDAFVFVAEIHAGVITPRFFRAGLSVAGEPLVTFGNHLLECTLDTIKPAHVVFLYFYDKPYVGYSPWNSAAPAPLALILRLPIPTRF